MRHVSASKLPRVAACPASPAQSEGCVDSGHKAGRFGHAFHTLMEVFGKKGESEALLGLNAIALTNAIDPADLTEAYLSNTFDPFKGRHPEHEVRGDLMLAYNKEGFYPASGPWEGSSDAGRIKIVGAIIDWRDEIADGHWLVVDYKTGNPDFQDDAERSLQALSYGVATILDKGAEKVTVQFYFPKHGEQGWTEPYTFDREEALVIHDAIERMVAEADQQWDKPIADRRYSVGEHCTFCPGARDCPARLAPMAAAYNAIQKTPMLKKDGTPGKRMITTLDFDLQKENAVDVLLAVRYARKAADLLSDKIKELVSGTGPIEAGDGKELDLRTIYQAPHLNLEHVQEALLNIGLSDVDQVKVLHELRTLEKGPVERLDIYKVKE